MQWELYIQIVDCEFCIDSSAAGASKFGHADRWNHHCAERSGILV
jgi:cytochrome c5